MIELIYPPNRLEALLASAAGEESWEPDYTNLQAPRIELYLRKILGEDVELPERPITRVEAFLAYRCGEDVELPTPITRIEMFLAKDTSVEPAEMPEPQTRIEYYLLNLQAGGGVELTATGNAPVTLANAIAHAIVSLTQEGKVTQASTPTPSSPVDLVCNNGALKMVDDELPSGYKRVLGFTCDNNAVWEITDFHLQGADTVRISFSVNAACNVWGCYQGADATDNYDLYASTSSGSKYFRYGNGTYLSYWSPDDLGERFDVVYTPTGSSGMPQDSTWSPLTFTSENNLLIGSTTLTGTSAKLKGNLYGNFVVDGRLKLIPCERVSDGVLGYYDTYSETFYEPYTGFTGAVSLGYDGSHYSLAVVGDDEVLNVYGNDYDNATMGTVYGVTLNSVVSDNTIKAGSATSIKLPCEPNTDYTIGFIKQPSSGNIFRVGTAAVDDVPTTSNPVTAINGVVSTNYNPITINSGDNATTMWVQIGSPVQASFADLIVQKGTSLNIQTASVADLFAVGDYKDTQEIIGGTVNRAVGVAVLDGTETVTVEKKCYVLTLADKVSAKTQMYCSHFAYANSNTSTVADGKMVTYSPAKVGFRYDALHSGSETIIAEKTITGNEMDEIPLSAQEIAAIQTLNNGDTVVLTVDGVAKTVTTYIGDYGGGMKYWAITDNYETVDIQANSENVGSIMLCASGTFTIKLEAPTPMVGSQFADFATAQYNVGTPIIVLYPLAEETTETVAGQHLTTAEGTNTVSVTSNVDPVALTVVYKGTEEGE